MKLQSEPDLDYQHQAVEAVSDLFRGQEICRTEFMITKPRGKGMEDLYSSTLGLGNRLTLLDDEVLANLSDIQLRNGLAPSGTLASGDFVETTTWS